MAQHKNIELILQWTDAHRDQEKWCADDTANQMCRLDLRPSPEHGTCPEKCSGESEGLLFVSSFLSRVQTLFHAHVRSLMNTKGSRSRPLSYCSHQWYCGVTWRDLCVQAQEVMHVRQREPGRSTESRRDSSTGLWLFFLQNQRVFGVRSIYLGTRDWVWPVCLDH